MAKIPVHNTTAMPIYVGASMVPAGEIRHFDEEDVPAHLRPAAQVEELPAPPPDAIHKLVVSASKKEVLEAIPGLTDKDLARLGDEEQRRMTKDKPSARKEVLAAIAEEQLRRAEQQG
jgi:hypothetical protein